MDIDHWITVMNPDGIKNANVELRFHDTCIVESYRNVQPVGKLGEQMLYAVTRPNAAGTQCPTGTFFLMRPADLAGRQAAEQQKEEEKERQRAAIRTLLKQQ